MLVRLGVDAGEEAGVECDSGNSHSCSLVQCAAGLQQPLSEEQPKFCPLYGPLSVTKQLAALKSEISSHIDQVSLALQ